MKQLLLFILIPVIGFSQHEPCNNKIPVGAGITAGYSSRNVAVGEMFFGFKPAEHIVIYPLSIKVHSAMSDPSIPTIFESRVGYKLSSWEIYGGYGYHFAGQDGKAQYNKYRGFKPGAGIIKHFGRSFIVTTAISGNVATLQLGFFTAK